jgi:C1q domain
MKKILLFALLIEIQHTLSAQVLRPIKIQSPSVSPAAGSCCGFRAYNSTELPMSVVFAKENTIVFDKELFDDANTCNGAAYKAPADGVYQFAVQLGLKAKNSGTEMSQVLLKVKTTQQSSSKLINIPPGYDNVISGETSVLFRLKAGEEVSVTVTGMGSAIATTTGNLSYFSGCRLY